MSLPNHVQRHSLFRLHPRERLSVLLLGDFLVALAALGTALLFWGSAAEWLGLSLEFLEQRVPPWFYLLPIVWLLLLVEIYDLNRASNWGQTVRGIITAAVIGGVFYLALYFYFSAPPKSLLPRLGVAAFLGAAVVYTLAWRYLYIRLLSHSQFMRRVLLVGAGRTGQTLLQVIKGLRPPPFQVVGLIDDDASKIGATVADFPVLAGCDRLPDLIVQHQISDIIVAISGEMKGSTFQTLLDIQECGVTITRMPVVYEELLRRVPIRLLEADWILRSFVDQTRVSLFYELLKRLLDILGGLVGCALLLVSLPFVGLAILIDSGWPVFYSQTRWGRGAQPYEIIKFRTMRQDAEADGRPRWAREDDRRATRVGRFLRKSHLDELPQFINVLRGEMSLVGPRAERPELVQLFQKHVPFYRARLLVKPGVTGWAQVNFGYAATIEETVTKLEYDLYYIKHRGLILDLVILLKTPAMMIGLRGT
jgi:exopolysaccharide biosynthesis polyprenyl glycosylphosphotransferase